MITITNPGGLVIIVTLTKHENKRINNNKKNYNINIVLITYILRHFKKPQNISKLCPVIVKNVRFVIHILQLGSLKCNALTVSNVCSTD